MQCRAMIINAVEKTFTYRSGEKEGEQGSMKLLSFIDTDNPDGSACEVMLNKDADLAPLQALRMKTAVISLYQNGKYLNFGGIVKQ